MKSVFLDSSIYSGVIGLWEISDESFQPGINPVKISPAEAVRLVNMPKDAQIGYVKLIYGVRLISNRGLLCMDREAALNRIRGVG